MNQHLLDVYQNYGIKITGTIKIFNLQTLTPKIDESLSLEAQHRQLLTATFWSIIPTVSGFAIGNLDVFVDRFGLPQKFKKIPSQLLKEFWLQYNSKTNSFSCYCGFTTFERFLKENPDEEGWIESLSKTARIKLTFGPASTAFKIKVMEEHLEEFSKQVEKYTLLPLQQEILTACLTEQAKLLAKLTQITNFEPNFQET